MLTLQLMLLEIPRELCPNYVGAISTPTNLGTHDWNMLCNTSIHNDPHQKSSRSEPMISPYGTHLYIFHPIYNIANQQRKDSPVVSSVIILKLKVLKINHHRTSDTTCNNRVQRSLQTQPTHTTSHTIYLSRKIKASMNMALANPNCMVDTTSLVAKITRGSVNNMTNWDSYSLHLPSRREDTRQQHPPQSQPI